MTTDQPKGITMTTTQDASADFTPHDVTQRREFITLLAMDDDRTAMANLAENIGEDVLPYVIQVLARELLQTGAELMSLRDEVQTMGIAVKSLGAMSAGMLGMERRSPDEEDAEFQTLFDSMYQDGALIRSRAAS